MDDGEEELLKGCGCRKDAELRRASKNVKRKCRRASSHRCINEEACRVLVDPHGSATRNCKSLGDDFEVTWRSDAAKDSVKGLGRRRAVRRRARESEVCEAVC